MVTNISNTKHITQNLKRTNLGMLSIDKLCQLTKTDFLLRHARQLRCLIKKFRGKITDDQFFIRFITSTDYYNNPAIVDGRTSLPNIASSQMHCTSNKFPMLNCTKLSSVINNKALSVICDHITCFESNFHYLQQ